MLENLSVNDKAAEEPKDDIDWSLKVYTQLAREGVVLTQDGDTELSLVFIQPSSDSSW